MSYRDVALALVVVAFIALLVLRPLYRYRRFIATGFSSGAPNSFVPTPGRGACSSALKSTAPAWSARIAR
jgi:hypothetical protein